MGVVWFFLALYAALRLPIWLDAWPLWHCLCNWCAYRRWSPCRHRALSVVTTPIDMGGVSAIAEVICETCGLAVLRDTWTQVTLTPAEVQKVTEEIARETRREARRERLRLWLVRWLLPPLREYQVLCRLVGTLLVSTALALWLCWGLVGEPLLEAVLGSPACRQVRLDLFVVEAHKQAPCWSVAPMAAEYLHGIEVIPPRWQETP